MIADIADAEQPAIRRLILDVEGPVLRVGQLVVDVVAAEQEGSEQIARRIFAIQRLGEVRQQRRESSGALRRSGGRRGAERRLERGALAGEDRRCTNGGARVTPNGPLNPNPALGENSLNNSPRS